MSSYVDDRAFTDFVHRQIAVPIIYAQLGWREIKLTNKQAEMLDIRHGIDYVCTSNNSLITIQERFRDKQYSSYSDFTIRYRRDNNPIKERATSEYYKMKADYFVYGIVNGNKDNFESIYSFLKYAVINLAEVYASIDAGNIRIEDNGQSFCRIIKDTLICPVKYNKDGSSSFFPIDIKLVSQMSWGENIIVYNIGF